MRMVRSRASSSGLLRVSAANPETPLALEVLHHRSTVAAGESDRVLDDVGQHLVQDQARSDGLADLAESLHLLDPAGQLRASVLQRSHQMHIPHDDRRLRSEAFEQRLLPFVEGVDLGSVHRKASNDLAVEQHRRRHRAADATLLLHVTAHELGVGEHVGDLLDPAFYSRPSDHRAAVHLHREVGHVADELLR